MRAVKAKALRKSQAEPVRVKLPEADYWRLRTAIRDVEAVQLDAMKAAQEFGRRSQEAQQKANAQLVALAKAHGFDPTKTYGWDDETLELIEQVPQT